MSEPTSFEKTRHLMLSLQQTMQDPALSGGCFLLGELFATLAEEPAARPLLEEIPAWKLPGLLLSAALLYRAAADPGHPLAPFLADPGRPPGPAFRSAMRRALTDDKAALAALAARHTYQCNPPRRMAISLLAAATAMPAWEPALHIDVGTASGIGLLLGDVRLTSASGSIGSEDAALSYPLTVRGNPPDWSTLQAPRIASSVGIDLDPPDLRDPASLAWMRACQFPLAAELAYFDRAIDILRTRSPRIERGNAIGLLPTLASEMPSGQPLLVTDTYATVFMSEEEREEFRTALDAIARVRPVVWVSNNPLVPTGPAPDRTTAGAAISAALAQRYTRELFGAVSVTTWPQGKRTPRLLGINHPGACWLELQ